MKVVAIIQARMQSTRLPGKVLMNLGGHPVLAWAVRAAKAAPGVDEVWVATSTEKADDVVKAWCDTLGDVNCFRGSETDVLERFVGAADAAKADVILRLTADCPFLDPQVIGAVVRLQKQTQAHYVSNVSPRTYPDGLDVEAFTLIALIFAHTHATRPIDRDCVTTIIARNRSLLRAEALINPIPGMEKERWVLDTGDDLQVCTIIAQQWPWEKGPPSMLDVLGVFDVYPTMRNINNHHPTNERYFDALAEEPIYVRSFGRSQAQLEKAKAVIPLGAQTFSKSYLQYPQPGPLFVSHGDAGLVWDVDGNEYVDLVSALLPNILGYRDPDVDAAIRRQVNAGISFSLATELEAELAETLCRLIPCAEAVRFGKNGSDVNVAAVRVARAFTGRDKILTCSQYHGWGDSLLAGSDRDFGIPKVIASLVTRIPFGDMDRVRTEVASGQYAAVVVEPTHGYGFLGELRSLTMSTGTILIFDEVVTGIRWHIGGAQAYFGITPDLATFGKAIGNGMPISAIVGSRHLMRLMEPPDNIFFSSTFGGETLSLAAAIATMKKLEAEKISDALWVKSKALRQSVLALQRDLGISHAFEIDETPLARLTFARPEWQHIFSREMIASGTLIVASNNLCHAHSASDMKRVEKSYRHALTCLASEVLT